MRMVLLTALGVGGATAIGAVLGFIFKRISHRFSDIVLAFAAGVMLAAAVLGLVVPSVDYGVALFPGREDSFFAKGIALPPPLRFLKTVKRSNAPKFRCPR